MSVLLASPVGEWAELSTLNTLRAIGRTLHAWVIPSEAWIYDADSAFTEDGHIKDLRSEQRVREVGRKIARLTRMLASKEARELLHLWEDDEADTPSSDNNLSDEARMTIDKAGPWDAATHSTRWNNGIRPGPPRA